MQGNINLSGNTINNLAAVPALPNGAAPAQWVLNQIAAVSLFQGQWDADTNVPDLTQLQYRVNGYTWIAITTSVSGVVVGQAIPGLQGKTIFNGDTIIYSTVDGAFFSIHAGGMSVPEAESLFVQLAGSQMSGALLLNANASQPLQAVTFQQLEAFVPPGAVGEAPNDGQLYGRNGLTTSWAPVLPLAGGILTGALTLFGNATANLNPVPLQQMNTAITAATAGYLPLGGGAMTGPMTLSGNATVSLNPVPLQQVNAMLAAYMPLSGGTFTGPVTLPAGSPTSPTLNFGTAGAFSANAAGNAINCSTAFATVGNTSVGGALAVNGGTTYFDSSGAFFMQAQSTAHVLQWTTGWSDNWVNNGTRTWANPSGNIMVLDASGNLSITGVLTQGSDERSKGNIAAFAPGVSIIGRLLPKVFTYNSDTASPQFQHLGFMAQDVQPVLPQAVSGSEATSFGLDTTPIIAVHTNTLNQLLRRIAALEAAANITPPAADTA